MKLYTLGEILRYLRMVRGCTHLFLMVRPHWLVLESVGNSPGTLYRITYTSKSYLSAWRRFNNTENASGLCWALETAGGEIDYPTEKFGVKVEVKLDA